MRLPPPPPFLVNFSYIFYMVLPQILMLQWPECKHGSFWHFHNRSENSIFQTLPEMKGGYLWLKHKWIGMLLDRWNEKWYSWISIPGLLFHLHLFHLRFYKWGFFVRNLTLYFQHEFEFPTSFSEIDDDFVTWEIPVPFWCCLFLQQRRYASFGCGEVFVDYNDPGGSRQRTDSLVKIASRLLCLVQEKAKHSGNHFSDKSL
jgi:hypothetical protein